MFNNNTKHQSKKILSEQGRIIGWKDGDAICKNAKASKHMLQIPRGWAWDVFVLERARDEGYIKTFIYDKENDFVYQANLRDFWQHGVFIDRGYGEQICLPLRFWQVINQGGPVSYQLALPI